MNQFTLDIRGFVNGREYVYPSDFKTLSSFFSFLEGCEDVVIQKGTGLKDPSGKLIYEGDVMANNAVVCYDQNHSKWKAVSFDAYKISNGEWYAGHPLHRNISNVIGTTLELN